MYYELNLLLAEWWNINWIWCYKWHFFRDIWLHGDRTLSLRVYCCLLLKYKTNFDIVPSLIAIVVTNCIPFYFLFFYTKIFSFGVYNFVVFFLIFNITKYIFIFPSYCYWTSLEIIFRCNFSFFLFLI